MNKLLLQILSISMLVLQSTGAATTTEDGWRFTTILHDYPGYTVQIQEGEMEPVSMGSYTVKVYKPNGEKDPCCDYIDGIVKDRDGHIISATLKIRVQIDHWRFVS